ncbi:MAG: exonuclease domain-containing protein [bacterium]
MLKIEDINFIVVDVETTGSNNRTDKIIDIACVIVNNFEVVDEYSSLVNPGCKIPPLITDITGIHNSMVSSAPNMKYVVPFVQEFIEIPDAVFTAHFAKFDYYFVREAFINANFTPFNIPMLDTLKLAQKILPDERKKNVGSLANYFGVPVMNRHRALGDAKATAYTLIEFLKIMKEDYMIEDLDELMAFQNNVTYVSKSRKEKAELLRYVIEQLPQGPGIYKFLDISGRIVYIGKAKDLRKRVSSYFQNSRVHSKKIAKLVSIVNNVEHTKTLSELSALIMENNLIKTVNPEYNTAQKKPKLFPFIQITNEDFPQVTKTNQIENDGSYYIGPFSNTYILDYFLHILGKKFYFRKCTGVLSPNLGCMNFQIKRCQSPCSGLVTKEAYRIEIENLKKYIFEDAFTDLEKSAHSFENRKETELKMLIERLLSDLKRLKSNPKPAIYDQNYIAVIKNDSIELVLMIKHGLLAQEFFIDGDISKNKLIKQINKLYYSSNSSKDKYSREEVEECIIINNWFRANKSNLSILELPKKENINEFVDHNFILTENLFNQEAI